MNRPPEPYETFDPEAILKVFMAYNVDYVVIGGYAAQLHGGVFPTRDLDIVPKVEESNLRRLYDALLELSARIRLDKAGRVTSELPSDPQGLTSQQVLTLVTNFGRLDLVIDPIGYRGGYREIIRSSEKLKGNTGLLITVIGLDDLITSKQAIRREKDIASLAELQRIRDHKSKDIH